MSEKVSEKIIRWYEEKGRDFPWRNTDDPYHILLAEMMLQKTSATQVLPIYQKMLERWLTPETLAEIDVDKIADVIYPLGLQNVRSKRFKRLAKTLVKDHGGEVPDTEEDLTELPGVGYYISSAVRCIAFEEPIPMLDANAGRLFGRYYFGEKLYSEIDDKIRDKVSEIFPEDKAREFNLGVIDMGALVCKQTHPRCSLCPIKEDCLYLEIKEY